MVFYEDFINGLKNIVGEGKRFPTNASLARHCNVPAAFTHRYLAGDRESHLRSLGKILDPLGAKLVFPGDQLVTQANPMPEPTFKAVPLVGLNTTNSSGWFMPYKMSISMPRMSDQAHNDGLFAVMMPDESMRQEGISAGYICYCDPLRAPAPGDAAIVESKKGHFAIRLFLDGGGSGYFKCQNWTPEGKPNIETIPAMELRRVIPITDVKRKIS